MSVFFFFSLKTKTSLTQWEKSKQEGKENKKEKKGYSEWEKKRNLDECHYNKFSKHPIALVSESYT